MGTRKLIEAKPLEVEEPQAVSLHCGFCPNQSKYEVKYNTVLPRGWRISEGKYTCTACVKKKGLK